MDRELQKLIHDIKAAEANIAELKNQVKNYNPSSSIDELQEFNQQYPENIEEYKVKLEEKEKLLQKTEEFSNVGRWTYIFEPSKLEWSEETYKIFDYPDGYEGSLNEFYMACLDRKTFERLPEQDQKLRVSRDAQVMNHTIHTPSGNTKLLTFTSTPIYNSKNEIIGVEGFVKDLTDDVSGKKGLDNFFNLSSDLHCIVHMDRYFVKVSPSWSELLGYSEKELLSRSFLDFIHPEDVEKSDFSMNNLNDEKAKSAFENRYITKSGEIVYLSWNSRLDEETQLSYATARDITESKLAQDELLSDLGEKDLLLREIHHRVKNNLQIITSLLSLQAGVNNEHDQLADLYEDSKNRIKSMAAIHEMFYQSKQLDKIEFGEYLDKLIGDLSKSISSSQRSIDLNLDVEPIFVSLDTAIPLGLLMNEIVTNSIKHGADENGLVKVYVKVETLEDHRLKLTIGDHGVNRPKDILTQSGDSLGVMLINSLVEQIDGEITQLNDFEGTVYQLIFSTKK